jgi:hypothetical protein
MKFMFPPVYRVTQKDFYFRPYTSMWAPVVARQIPKRYSSSCHVFISIIDLRGLLENDSRTRSTVSSVTCCLGCFPDTVRTVLYLNDIQALAHWSSWAYNISHADKQVARAWISFRYLSSYNRCPHWSVRTCIKIFLSYSVHCWQRKFHKAFRH